MDTFAAAATTQGYCTLRGPQKKLHYNSCTLLGRHPTNGTQWAQRVSGWAHEPNGTVKHHQDQSNKWFYRSKQGLNPCGCLCGSGSETNRLENHNNNHLCVCANPLKRSNQLISLSFSLSLAHSLSLWPPARGKTLFLSISPRVRMPSSLLDYHQELVRAKSK